jgi:hypothetical protein
MSLHSKRRNGGDGKGNVIASCLCGWSETVPNGDKAHVAYREHIEAALGANGYYFAAVCCSNCGTEGMQNILVGVRVASEHTHCATCGNATLIPCNEHYRDHERQP